MKYAIAFTRARRISWNGLTAIYLSLSRSGTRRADERGTRSTSVYREGFTYASHLAIFSDPRSSRFQRGFGAGTEAASESGSSNRTRTPGFQDSRPRYRVQQRSAFERAFALRRYPAARSVDHARSTAGSNRSRTQSKG